MSRSSARAVSMMMGRSRLASSRRRDRVSSRPLESGSIQSTSTRSGRPSAIRVRAEEQSSASSTSKPARVRLKAIICRIGASSSTINTFRGAINCGFAAMARFQQACITKALRNQPESLGNAHARFEHQCAVTAGNADCGQAISRSGNRSPGPSAADPRSQRGAVPLADAARGHQPCARQCPCGDSRPGPAAVCDREPCPGSP